MYSSEIGARQATTASIVTDSASLKTQTAGVNGKNGAAGTPAVATADEARISAAGSQMAGQTTAVSGGSDVRTEKVAALRMAIESGSYKVPAAQVADKLIEGMKG